MKYHFIRELFLVLIKGPSIARYWVKTAALAFLSALSAGSFFIAF